MSKLTKYVIVVAVIVAAAAGLGVYYGAFYNQGWE